MPSGSVKRGAWYARCGKTDVGTGREKGRGGAGARVQKSLSKGGPVRVMLKEDWLSADLAGWLPYRRNNRRKHTEAGKHGGC